MNFIKTNPNPEGKKTGDCVIRAIAIAEKKSWIEVYDALCELGREMSDMPNMKKVYETYLIKNGWVKQKMPKHSNGKRYKLRELADENPKGVFIMGVVHHIATVIDGDLYDTWDCGRKCVGNYFSR